MKQNLEELRSTIEEHKLLCLQLSNVDCEGNRDGSKVFLKKGRKYTYVDYGNGSNNSGLYLVDKDNNVYTIKAYGQRGYYKGSVQSVMEQYKTELVRIEAALQRKSETGSYGALALSLY